jgi:thioesterase domain-containing protein
VTAPPGRGAAPSGTDRALPSRQLLISVRGWSADDDPRYPAFVERLRDSGVDVHDLFVPPDPFPTMADWARAVIAEISTVALAGEPLHLLGYCLGGHVLLEVVGQLQASAQMPGYVGLIDCWYRPPAHWVDRGIYGRYGVAWSRRVRHQAARIAPPHAERPSVVLRSWAIRTARTTGRVLRGRTSSRQRPEILNWQGQHLAYDWFYPRLTTPVHVYNAEVTVDDMGGDPSIGLSPYLVGGFEVQVLPDSGHRTCLQPPTSERLIELIGRDRAAAADRDVGIAAISPR